MGKRKEGKKEIPHYIRNDSLHVIQSEAKNLEIPHCIRNDIGR
ncbi:hypothetical protein [Altibacter sp.]|nr:hypothetical protein [Altibacter sp.]